jgi:Zn-finger nucleic acid-binding protein
MRLEQTRGGAEIDVCDACGGLWADWFDGELHAIAADAESLRVERGTPLPPPRAPLAGACPRCVEPLAPELYRFSDAREGELITGVELFRCAGCLGAFVPRGSAQLLLDRREEGPPATLWEAALAFLRRVFGPSAARPGEPARREDETHE